MSVVVSDASPLINLARAGHFDLRAAFYGQIWGTGAVRGYRPPAIEITPGGSQLGVHLRGRCPGDHAGDRPAWKGNKQDADKR